MPRHHGHTHLRWAIKVLKNASMSPSEWDSMNDLQRGIALLRQHMARDSCPVAVVADLTASQTFFLYTTAIVTVSARRWSCRSKWYLYASRTCRRT